MSDAAGSRKNASEDEVATWVREVLPKGLAYARSLIRDDHTAEDIVHDCICRLLDRKDRYDLPEDGLKLLLRSISNASIDRIRKVEPWSLGSMDFDEKSWLEPVDRCSLEPIANVMNRELESAIREALQKLPLKQRAALELKSFGLRLDEIAESLDVSESNAGVLLHRARVAMARELAAWVKDKK